MAQVVSGNQVRLSNGQTVAAQQGGWYDGQQFWGGTLSNPGQINSLSNQQGAGQNVSNQVIAQTNPNNVAYIQQQQQQAGVPSNGSGGIPQATGGGGTGAGLAGGLGVTTPQSLNLPDLYTNLQKSAGIDKLEQQLADEQNAFNDASSKINDNPFLSEADRTGRIQKLNTDYLNNTKSVQDQLTMKKQDIQTQLDLAQKQFDINSQQAQQAMTQFNSLLSSGALDNASGSDIAALTKATGMSSDMILSAINASKAKNQPTQVVQFDDGTNQGFAVIDPKTGNIISKQVIAGSKPTKGSASAEKLTPADYAQYLVGDAQNGADLKSLVEHYRPYLPIAQIYQLYNSSSVYGKAKETLAQVEAGKFSD